MTVTKSKQSDILQGVQTPTISVIPEHSYSLLDECLETNALGGLNPFEWQANVLYGWLTCNSLGKWAASTGGLSVPRQNGKSLGVVAARCNYGLLILQEEIIYTAHLQKTATETFEGIASFFADTPKINKHVKAIREALGRESIVLKSGARIKFLARTRAGGRGQHGSLLIYDEAQELDSSQQASFKFAISASPNPQTLYLGTPPDENTPAVVFRRIRKRAIAGDTKKSAYFEWGVDHLPDFVEASNPSLWEITNPSLGLTIMPETIESELEDTDLLDFSRERLGWWDEKDNPNAVFSKSEWSACEIEKLPSKTDDEIVCLGIKFTPDGSHVAVSVAIKQGTETYIEGVFYESMDKGTSWLAEWINNRKSTIAEVWIDGKVHSSALYKKIKDGGFQEKAIRILGTRDVTDSSAIFYDAVTEEKVLHAPQELMDESATKAQKRFIGDKNSGGWGFGDGTVSCAPIESASFAYMAVITTKRNPRRKLRIG